TSWGDESRGAAHAHRAGTARMGRAPQRHSLGAAGHHGPMAGERTAAAHPGRTDPARPRLCEPHVARARPQDSRPHGSGSAQRTWRLLMRVLISGGAGFIGSHIAEAFLERSSQVLVLDNLSTGERGNLPEAA